MILPMKRLARVFGLVFCSWAFAQQQPVSGGGDVPHRGVYEVRLAAGASVEDPYLGVKLRVTFVTPGGDRFSRV